MAIYAKFDSIRGDVTDKDHENWTRLLHVDTQIGRDVPLEIGRGNDNKRGMLRFSEITLLKTTDASSIDLLYHLLDDSVLDKVTIEFCRTENASQPYLRYILTNAFISEYFPSEYSDEEPTEVIKLAYTQFEIERIPYDSQGNPQGSSRIGYNLSKGTKV